MKTWTLLLCCLLIGIASLAEAQKPAVIAFYTGKNDQAHISFVKEANKWFPGIAQKLGFTFESTTDWSKLNTENLKKYKLVMFLDTRPENIQQRQAFEQYMKNGGRFMGFHFAAFAMTPSTYPQNWNWYHNEFLGSGQYVSNTWEPTPATLRVENPTAHPVTKNLPAKFKSQANEWYRWEKNLKANPDITLLLVIDESSFPLGNKAGEIWYSGYYPVVWTNKKYKMVYFNMGHNDIDYSKNPPTDKSHTFGSNPTQDQLFTNTITWLLSN